MLVTRQNKVPFLWLIMVTLPWALFYFNIQVNGVNFFILNRLIDNPAALTFFFSLPGLIFMFIPLGPYISFMSDRIWTRWGRRKIFLIINFTGMAFVMFLYPLAPNVWLFLMLMCFAALFGCFGAPFEALKLEIIPSDMRGRSAAMNTWVATIINIVFNLAVIGRFDEVIPYLGGHISGIKILYWSASIGLLIVVFNYLYGIHEVPPKSTITGEKFSFKKAWKAMTMPQLRYLYVFMIASTLLAASLGSLGTLLYINQWGYSFQEMGVNIAVGGIINLFLIPAVGIFADRGRQHRMKIWIITMIIVKILTLGYFAYVTWYLPDQRPSLVEIIFFGELTCIVGIIGGMVYYPLVYDYIPRNLMGTYMAGCGIFGGIIGFFTTNGLGVFLMYWAQLFQPPAGEMVRVCLEREMQQPQVAQVLHQGGLVTPGGTPAASRDVVAKPWYANGIVKESGVCYEIRLRDKDGEKMMKRRDELKSDIDTLNAKIMLDRKEGAAVGKIAEREKELAALKDEHEPLEQTLKKRTESWRAEVLRGLDSQLMKEGAEVLGEASSKAVIAEMPTLRKASGKEIDKLNQLLWAEDPAAIGLNAVRRDRGFALSLSAVLAEGQDPDEVGQSLCRRLALVAEKAAPGLISSKESCSSTQVKPAEVITLSLVENPVKTFVSPITRVMNALLSNFVDLPTADQKLVSLARNVCKNDLVSHARTDALEDRNGLKMTIVAGAGAMGDKTGWMPRVLALFRTECAALKLTVPAPVIDQGVVPIKYNYMSGYLYIFLLVLIGFGMVMYFLHMEKIGVVRKWGAEEAHAENKKKEEEKRARDAEQAANNTAAQRNAVAPETYTPGYLLPKILFALVGLGMMGVAFQQSWPHLRLLAKGEAVEAIAASVVVMKPGQSEVVIHNQVDLDAKIKEVKNAKDYQWTFFNEYTFESKDGQAHTYRHGVGCKLKPTVPLLDENGLPTTARLLYDAEDTTRAVLPLEYSTWLAPTLTGVLGLIMFALSATLAWFARKPIILSSEAAVNLSVDAK